MKPYKLNITRPEFLANLMTSGDIGALNMKNMKKTLYDTTPLCYCTYTVLMDANVTQDDVAAMYNDGESIAITFYDKNKAKQVKDLCNKQKQKVRYGSSVYSVKLKVRDNYLISEVTETKSNLE